MSEENTQQKEDPRDADSARIFLVVVDDTEEMKKALRFACGRARHTGGRVALLHVIEWSEFRSFLNVGDLMYEEARNEAEVLMQRLAAKVSEEVGRIPVLYMREGNRRDELLSLIEEEPDISILILGASVNKGGPGPLIKALTGKLISQMRIPVTIVPGNLSDDEVDAIS